MFVSYMITLKSSICKITHSVRNIMSPQQSFLHPHRLIINQILPTHPLRDRYTVLQQTQHASPLVVSQLSPSCSIWPISLGSVAATSYMEFCFLHRFLRHLLLVWAVPFLLLFHTWCFPTCFLDVFLLPLFRDNFDRTAGGDTSHLSYDRIDSLELRLWFASYLLNRIGFQLWFTSYLSNRIGFGVIPTCFNWIASIDLNPTS